MQSYDVFVSENGGEYVRWLSETTATSAEYAGSIGKTYAFYSLARDNVGNLELPPLTPDALTSIFGFPHCSADSNSVCRDGFGSFEYRSPNR